MRQMSTVRRWRLLSGGCFVFVVFGSALIILIVVLLIRAPSYIFDPAEIREFLVGSRLSAALIILILAQAFTSYLLGLLSASSAAAITHPDANPTPRTRIIGRRLLLPGITALLVKLGVIAVGGLGLIVTSTDWLGPRVDFGPIDWFDSSTHFLWYAAAVVFVPVWLAEPFLRIRYSAALGALAGTWASARRDKLALGLTARLAFGLMGVLAGIWGITLMTMVHRVTEDVLFVGGYVDYSGRPLTAQLLLWVVPIFALGQILLPFVYLRLARVSRVDGGTDGTRKSFATWSQKNTATEIAGGSE